MVLVVALTAGLFVWGVVIVAVDFFAKRHQREEAERRATDARFVADEAEWWLRHHR